MATNGDRLTEAWGFQRAGDLTRAEVLYRDVLQQEPRNARAWYLLSTLWQAQRRLPEAVTAIRQALDIRPDEAGGHFHLGNLLLEQRQWVPAEVAFRRCLELQPDHVGALTNLGVVLTEQGNLEYAVACFRRALTLKPDSAEAHYNLGNLFRRHNNSEEAVRHFRAAVAAKPDYAAAYTNLGAALAALGQAYEAIPFLEESLRLRPNHAETHNSLGAALSTQGRVDEAIAQYEQAVALRPDYAEVHWNLALALLLLGNYERGWQEYEWRWRWRHDSPNFAQPHWDGGPLNGQAILLYSEQGLGDTLQFIRYAAIVKERGGTVLVQCQPALVRLLSRCTWIDRVVPSGGPLPEFAVQAALMSLGGILGTTLDTIPAHIPYVLPDPQLVEHWRLQLAPIRGLRVGIAWQGSSTHAWDRHRSIPLEQFEPLAHTDGVCLISLQKGPETDVVAGTNRRVPMVALGPRFDVDAGPFMDTAAVMQHLDLVITADTAIAHLAGALGVPVWVGLCSSPDWRWGMHGETTPWYPSMRLFRQTAQGDWGSVFARMAEELKRLSVARTASAPVLIEVSPGELLDRITILEIKSERIPDPQKLASVRDELAALEPARTRVAGHSEEVARLMAELRAVNEALWQMEDDLRLCERDQDFGSRFVELARLVYRHNDRRGALKRRINELLGARLAEAKCYADYPADCPPRDAANASS